MSAVIADLVHPDIEDPEQTYHWDEAPPTDYGFHCDSECYWDAPEDLYTVLSRYYGADRSPPGPPTWHDIPETLHPIQDYINPSVVDYYESGGEPVEETRAKGNAYPRLVRLGGEHYVFQGTHCLAALRRSGARRFLGHVVQIEGDGGTWHIVPGDAG